MKTVKHRFKLFVNNAFANILYVINQNILENNECNYEIPNCAE